ncbi:cytochrome c [Robertkochia marina]|uniref:Cytochrome c n=1 Tax=Robertkochia marina TaxID=1227945 RepID=A0A4S3M2D5_9FLAO|nr:cytochrome c [Robertkochia marina]THD69282.1 cytochrome c [Robertkochia marina]TRZ47459.1 cytochrome c [Robertkochia marina]
MKIHQLILLVLLAFFVTHCDTQKKEKEGFQYEQSVSKKTTLPDAPASKPSETVDLSTKGIGPVSKVNIASEIDIDMAKKGEAHFKRVCLACHLPDQRMLGPAMKGITGRRTPEWIMNMIINPQEMALKDSLANALLKEYNQSIMPNQNITEEEARAMLEYFRTL